MADICTQCGDPKITAHCGLCQDALCKKCRQGLSAKDFQLLTTRPAHLDHDAYCFKCFDAQVAPALADYERLADDAKNVYMLTINYRGNVQVYSRHTKAVTVDKCDDRREMILKLAYQAAKLNFNAIISADLRSKKVFTDSGYSYFEWSGSALPASVNTAQLDLASLKGD